MSRQKVRLDQLVVPAGTPDGHVPTVDTGELTYAAPTGGTGAAGLVPLTTTVGGEPALVWDADNQLVMTEVPS